MVRKKSLRAVKLADLKMNYFVRVGLNQNHALMLADVYEAAFLEHKDEIVASRAVPPIIVTEDMMLVEGRHRKEAMELAGLKWAIAEIVEKMTGAELVLMAAKANYGSALPPTKDDMVYTISQLLFNFGMAPKSIEDRFAMIPKSVVRKYINQATKVRNEASLKLAVAEVATGKVTLQEAAKHHAVKVETLQTVIAGKKVKSQTGVAQYNSALSAYSQQFSHSVARTMKRAFDEYRDGDIPMDMVQQAINHLGGLVRRLFLRTQDYDNRLKAEGSGITVDEKHQHHWSNVDEITYSHGHGKATADATK